MHMRKPLFTGVCTALVTPFLANQVNYPMMEMLLRRQLDEGIPAVVISGTTGESATLTDEEKIELFSRCKKYVGNSMKIIAGTGSNSTLHTVELSLAAQEAGADALLIVSPYYNKATPDGLVAHYLSVAQAVNIPVIIYNVPSRTGVDIPVSVYQALARVSNIVGVKEASTDIEKILRIKSACPPEFSIWSGNDAMTTPILSLGGHGVISVSSNVFPGKMRDLVDAGLNGDFDTAAAIQCQLLELNDLLFCEVNPIGVKAAMKCVGYDCGSCRLPLTPLSMSRQKQLETYFA